MLKNKFIVITTARNVEQWIERSINSVLSQTEKDVGYIFIDDNSEDKTFKIAQKRLAKREHSVCKQTSERMYSLYNLIDAIRNHVSNPESIIVSVDADDYLLYPDTLKYMYSNAYINPKINIAWSQFMYNNGEKGINRDLKPDEDIWDCKWGMSHLKTFKKKLFDRIDERMFKIDKEWIPRCMDQVIMRPMLYLSKPDEWKFVNRILYYYNLDSDRYGANVSNDLLGMIEKFIKKRKYEDDWSR